MQVLLRNKPLEIEETSTVDHWIVKADNFARADELKEIFNEDYLKGAMFVKDGVSEPLEFIVPMELQAHNSEEGVFIHMITRKKTRAELQEEQLEELQTAVTELMERE